MECERCDNFISGENIFGKVCPICGKWNPPFKELPIVTKNKELFEKAQEKIREIIDCKVKGKAMPISNRRKTFDFNYEWQNADETVGLNVNLRYKQTDLYGDTIELEIDGMLCVTDGCWCDTVEKPPFPVLFCLYEGCTIPYTWGQKTEIKVNKVK